MLMLNKLVVSAITANATLNTLMGVTATDKRVYTFGTPRDTEFSSSKKALILFKFSFGKRPSKWSYPMQIPNASLYLRVQSIDPLVREQIADILTTEVFDLKIDTLKNDDVSVKYSELVARNDGTLEGTASKPVYTKNITFMFRNVFIR